MNASRLADTEEWTLGTIKQAAEAIANAECLLITAGAGMGVDSGFPDFRSAGGFWRAYPPLKALGLSFEQMALCQSRLSAVAEPRPSDPTPIFLYDK